MLFKTRDGFYVLKKLSLIRYLLHGFSTIDFGNMEVLKNRKCFAKVVGIESKRLISVCQEHGREILIVDSGSLINQTENTIADGLITRLKNVCLIIKTADCLPVLLCDLKKEAIGLVHAGRRGVSLKVHLEAVVKMRGNFGSQPEDLFVGIGPAICSRCYHGKIDLISSVLADFQEVGIKKENIEMAEVCTFECPDFYSHQRSKITGEPEGRFATLLSWS